MRGCIVVHGLTGTPACVKVVSDKLEQAGFQVKAPCLAGHGKTVADLAQVSWEDWYSTVKQSYFDLKNTCEQIFYAGISLGALLGLKLALDRGSEIKALALMGTPIQLARLEGLLVPAVRYTPLHYLIKSVKKDYLRSVADPQGRKFYQENSLPRIPAAAVFTLCDLQEVILKDLKKIHNPILLVHGALDTVAPLGNLELVKQHIASTNLQTLILDRSKHVVTLDYQKDLVAQEITKFFEKNA
ncbi:MAG: alpha/beta fold hydrolase [Pseudomonadota bacterium]